MAKVIAVGQPVNDAERIAIAHLRDHLADSFTVKVADNHGGSTTQLVTIDIVGTNDAPVINTTTTVASAEITSVIRDNTVLRLQGTA